MPPTSHDAMSESASARRDVITVSTVSRPKRIAFLIDPDNPRSESWVEEIIEQSIQRWGGGYHPIIATDGTSIPADGWRVLQAVDPDVICAVTPIDENLSKRLAETIAPGAIERLDERQREHLGAWIVGHQLSGLDTNELPRYLVGLQPWGIPHRFLYVHETPESDPGVRSFALRNFGTVRETISTKQTFEGLPVEKIPLDKTDVQGLLESFLRFNGRTTTLRDLSVSAAQRPYSLQHDGFAQGFHLVIGDSVRDIIYTWNRRLMSEEWMGHDVLWLPTSLATDTAFLEVVGKWVAHEYWNNQDRRGFVLSYSGEKAFLEGVAKVVSEAAWMHFSPTSLDPDRFPLPETRPATYGVFRDPPPRRTEQIPLVDDAGLLSIPVPHFLTSRRGPQDGWMVDLDIEYHLDPPRYSNKSDSWRLPKRTALGRQFAENAGLRRVVNGGFPSVEVKRGDQYIRLRIPSKRAILYGLLQPAHVGDPPAKARFSHFETSEQGRRLSGIIGLFGSLDYAGRTFDDAYWRSIFVQLSGVADNQTKSQVARVEEMLAQSADAEGIGTPETRVALARRIVGRLSYFARPTPSITWNEFQQRFSDIKRADSQHSSIGENESFNELKAREIGDFAEGGILVQGVSLSCDHCGKEGWWLTNALSPEMRCDGCLRTFPFPPSPTWRFRLNSLISNGITKVGVMAVLHALLQKSQFAHDLFFYLPCQALYEEYDGDPYTDLDLISIRDGQVIIGEVKSSTEAFLETDFAKLRSVAEEIRPNLVVLTATGGEWPPQVAREAEALQSNLASIGVTVETLLLPW